MPKVLVFTPYGPRLEVETVNAVLSLAWDGPISYLFQNDNPHGYGRDSILHQYQQGRRAFLAGLYDMMLVIEADIVPPPDALQRLAALQADCAYGVYRFRTSDVCNIFERYPTQVQKNIGSSLSLRPDLLYQARSQKVYDCTGGGLGCVLIQRHVLAAVDFRTDPKDRPHCDSYFNQDVLTLGFSQKADMNCICGHITEDGETVWPYKGETGFYVS